MNNKPSILSYILETFQPGVFQRRLPTFIFLLQRSWTAWLALACFLFFYMVGLYVFAGFFIVITAVLAMNGLAKTDLILAHRTPSWWRKHPTLKALHYINSEGEMAGIFVGVIIVIVIGILNPEDLSHIHWPIGEAFTLYGIMSFANWTVNHMVTIMAVIEKYVGKIGVVFTGSLLSAVTGEPAAAVFLSEYLQDRVTHENRGKLATSLAGSIGSGGGWLPFAAPPILIIWGVLSNDFGWGILDLMMFVGLGCITHALVVSIIASRYMKNTSEENLETPHLQIALITLGLLTLLVLAHIIFHSSPVIWLIDAIIGINVSFTLASLYRDKIKQLVKEKKLKTELARQVVKEKKLKTELARQEDEEYEHLHEKAFSATWQPLLLAFLLLALEAIGHVAEPFIDVVAHAIPETWPLLITAMFLFFVTAVTSHFADNALASRVFIVVAVSFLHELGPAAANLLAIAVIYGALFGGILLIPANLPNFAIARSFHIDAGNWIKNSVKLYWTGIVYAIALIVWSIMLIG